MEPGARGTPPHSAPAPMWMVGAHHHVSTSSTPAAAAQMVPAVSICSQEFVCFLSSDTSCVFFLSASTSCLFGLRGFGERLELGQRARCLFYGEPDNMKECFKMHRFFHDILKKTTLPTRHVSLLQ